MNFFLPNPVFNFHTTLNSKHIVNFIQIFYSVREGGEWLVGQAQQWIIVGRQLGYCRVYNRILSFDIHMDMAPKHTRREFLREILYKNIAIIAIMHSKCILLTP